MDLIIFRGISKPIYEQIFDFYRFAIVSGKLKPGDMIPSVRDTGRVLNINAMTVSKSYALLNTKGFVKLNPITRSYEVAANLVLSDADRRNLIEDEVSYLEYIKSCLEIQN